MIKITCLAAIILSITACKKNASSVSVSEENAIAISGFAKGPTVTDIDGNVSNSVVIGTQIWTVKNLNVSRYRNGDPIPKVSRAKQWDTLSTGAYCYYNNDATNGAVYGKLYNWYAVNDSRNIAPIGWHAASDSEWIVMINYLGGYNFTGGKLKEAGTVHWLSPNEGATNSSGFTALPGGLRDDGGGYSTLPGSQGYWWTSTPFEVGISAHNYYLLYSDSNISYGAHSYIHFGCSVRCIKD